MVLLKGFSEVDREWKVRIPLNIRDRIDLNSGTPVEIKVVRIKGSNLWPYLIVHPCHSNPRLSKFQIVMMEGKGHVDREGNLSLLKEMLEKTRLRPDYRVEVKLMGPEQNPWVSIHNLGLKTLSTQMNFVPRKKKDNKQRKRPIRYLSGRDSGAAHFDEKKSVMDVRFMLLEEGKKIRIIFPISLN